MAGCGAVGTGQCWAHGPHGELWAGLSDRWVEPGKYPPQYAMMSKLKAKETNKKT